MGKSSSRRSKTPSPPPIEKLIFPAIGIGLAILAYQFVKGMMLSVEIERVDLEDDMALREVFFGELTHEKSYAVLCSDESLPVSSVFQEAASSGKTPAAFRLLDCKHTLPDSSKTIAERFKLDLTKRPTIFVSGKVGPPKQIPTKHLKTGGMLIKVLKNMLERRATKVETTQDLRVKCLNQPHCGLLLKGTKSVDSATRKAMEKLVREQPNMAFCHVDTSNLYVKNLEDLLPPVAYEGQHRFVVFSKLSGSLDTKDSRLITSMAPLEPSVAYGPMSNLVADVLSKTQPTTKLSLLPQIKTRTKKLLQEEQAKRERKQQRQQEKEAAPSAPPTENDGSREGRRAERERRRAEHRAKTGYTPKTPEELQEMERQRRKRMEEEAAKWNIASDEDEQDTDTDDIMEETDEEEEDEDDDDDDLEDNDEDDDEDVLDLD